MWRTVRRSTASSYSQIPGYCRILASRRAWFQTSGQNLGPDNEHRTLTKEEADQILTSIQRDRGIRIKNGEQVQVENDVLVTNLNNALNILSDDLNAKSTHFLLELIQNADDNTYPRCHEPSFSITLNRDGQHGRLITTCNEEGFTTSHIRALCSVGASTKAGKDRAGFIGEKGIGFKSVFKVADVVNIKSGPWQFRFDRREKLGMILPKLSTITSANPETTQILLDLRSLRHYQMIQEELGKIDSEILLFLRKLHHLRIKTPSQDVLYSIRRNDHDPNLAGETKTIVIQNLKTRKQTEKTYLVVTHTVEDMPHHPKRPGTSQSDLTLAFPMTGSLVPIVEEQRIFAFLPISDHSLKFVLHGDFVLVANREAVDEDSIWNEALRDGVVEALVKAVHRFILISPMNSFVQHTWPGYLSGPSSSSNFWRKLQRAIISRLRHEKVLETAEGTLEAPENCLIIPPKYHHCLQPLVIPPGKKPVSSKYNGFLRAAVGLLGLPRMTPADMIAGLRDLAAKQGADSLASKTHEFHRTMASILTAPEFADFMDDLKALPIIPVQNGKWVQATTPNLYLPDHEYHDTSAISQIQDVFVVDGDAASDETRLHLFRSLGLSQLNPGIVCRIILDRHSHPQTRQSAEGWMQDAAYFFRHRGLLDERNCRTIRFLDNSHSNHQGEISAAELVPATQLYIHGACDAIARHSSSALGIFPVLDRRYARNLPDPLEESSGHFYSWVEASCGASKFPLLWDSLQRKTKRAFNFLAQNDPIGLIQTLAAGQGDHYRELMNNSEFRSALLSVKVPCRKQKGLRHPLGDTALPTNSLLDTCPDLNHIDIPTADASRYMFLSKFGVQTEVDVRSYLRELAAVKGSGETGHPTSNSAHRIYRGLAAHCDISSAQNRLIRRHFHSASLVWIGGDEGWVSHLNCIWESPVSDILPIPSLSKHYPDCQILFQTVLRMPKLSATWILDYLEKDSAMTCKHSADWLATIAMLADETPLSDTELERLRELHIFKVRQPFGTGPADVLCRSSSCAEWYIPDRSFLARAAESKVELLDVSLEQVHQLSSLFSSLGLENRYLSNAMTDKVEISSGSAVDDEMTDSLLRRLPYLRGLSRTQNVPFRPRVFRVGEMIGRSYISGTEITVSRREIHFEKGNEQFDTYLAHTLTSSMHLINYLLSKELCEELQVPPELTSLAMLLLNAPFTELESILHQHNIPLPQQQDAGDIEGSSAVREEQSNDQTPSPAAEALVYTGDTIDDSPRGDRKHATIPREEMLQILHRAPGSERPKTAKAAPPTTALLAGVGRPTKTSQMLTFRQPPSASRAAPSGIEVEELRNFLRKDLESVQLSLAHPPEGKPGSTGTGYSPAIGVPRYGDGNDAETSEKTEEVEQAYISGAIGEALVYNLLKARIPDFSFQNWTSQSRELLGHEPFLDDESFFADFTYADGKEGHMWKILSDDLHGLCMHPDGVKFHIEVKARAGGYSQPSKMSQNQMDLVSLLVS
ncbi:uncharacterized protein MKZ38_009006 [Zalerion maritima]|uniref:Sacsin/Nov domain-containing protein n=1 Tax=Zalerion maritima TaxID=339359 RepID=A0AAD5WNC8_9PEZI|nr:uncharacterized protein MKZ38_009006 [Zalerion maritima]